MSHKWDRPVGVRLVKFTMITVYFNKVLPCAFADSVNLSSSRSQCECPKPCKQTIYEPGLSQAALSVLSVDNILTENKVCPLTTSLVLLDGMCMFYIGGLSP